MVIQLLHLGLCEQAFSHQVWKIAVETIAGCGLSLSGGEGTEGGRPEEDPTCFPTEQAGAPGGMFGGYLLLES